MLHRLSGLTNSVVFAKGSKAGKVKDVLFDDEKWAVRYFVVQTGGWLFRRDILISPHSIAEVDWEEGQLYLSLTATDVESCPELDVTHTLSREFEARYHDRYGLPYYWAGDALWGMTTFPGLYPTLPEVGAAPPYEDTFQSTVRNTVQQTIQQVSRQTGGEKSPEPLNKVYLRSAKVVRGYQIHARDGDVGRVEDFLVDEKTWAIRYFVVNTSVLWSGRCVVLAPHWAQQMSWSEERVYVDLSKEQIKLSPQFDFAHINRECELQLYDYYGFLEKYWFDDEDPAYLVWAKKKSSEYAPFGAPGERDQTYYGRGEDSRKDRHLVPQEGLRRRTFESFGSEYGAGDAYDGGIRKGQLYEEDKDK